MKLTKRTAVFFAIGVFVAGALLLFNQWSGKSERLDELEGQLASTQTKVSAIQLDPLRVRKSSLEQNVTQTTAQLNAVETILALPIKKTDTMSLLFTTARSYNVEITTMSLSGITDTGLEQVPASSMSITITIEGSMGDITAFIAKLNTLFTTGAVDSATITNTATENSTKKPTADIKLTIYSVQNR